MTGAPDLFPTIRDLAASGYVFRIQDNGGATCDRITVLFSDGDYLALSWPSGSGFSQWGEGGDPVSYMDEQAESGAAVDLALGDLTPELRAHILRRVNEGWRDFIEAGTKRERFNAAPHAPCSRFRHEAATHDGTHKSGGAGIYAAGAAFCIRTEGGDDQGSFADFGPFGTFAEAVRVTLPEAYALAGPEYHSPLDPGSLRRTKGARAAVRALEAKQEPFR